MNDLQEWTVMYFFAADSSIAASMISQLKAINDAGFQADTTVLVHFDPNINGIPGKVFHINSERKKNSTKQPPTEIGDGKDFYVRTIREACGEPVELKGKSAADKLARFLKRARTDFPARNYILFLVGHGMIVASDSFLPDTDEDAASSITLKELGTVLKDFGDDVKKENHNFQLVGFHSCSMSSIEVAYELKDSARYMIGTQGLAFPGSWPYRQILKMIFRTIEGQTRKKGTKVLPDYDKITKDILGDVQRLCFYNADDFFMAGYSADISMCSLDGDKISPLTGAMKDLCKSLQAGLNDDAAKEVILLAHWKAQSYFQENYTDLYDFCKCLAGRCDPGNPTQRAMQEAAIAVQNLLAVAEDSGHEFDRLIPFSDFFGPEYQYSHGLSIYFPWGTPSDRVLKRYNNYAFEQALQSNRTNGHKQQASETWLSFLNAYFELTQRVARDREPEIFAPLNGSNGKSVLKVRAAAANGKSVASLGIGEGKPAPSLGLGEGKPAPSLGIGEGKPAPSLGLGEGKPAPSLGIGEGKPAPSLGLGEGKPAPSLGLGEGKPAPSLGLGEGKPAPSLGLGEGKPAPSLGLGEGKPAPSLGLGEGKPAPSLGFGEGKPAPSLGGGDGKPTPSMGVSGFGFTVTKNFPAPNRVLSSRPDSYKPRGRRRQ
jgi:Clostripain family